MNKFFVSLLICSLLSFNLWASRSRDSFDPKVLKRKITDLRAEILEMKQSIESLEHEQKTLAAELSDHEQKFQERFSKVLVPLLSWPQLPPAIQRTSWIEEVHLRTVLMKARDRLIHEPLSLIADRELMLTRVEENKGRLTEALKYLEEKEGMLNLQLEELQFLQKKMSRAKKG